MTQANIHTSTTRPGHHPGLPSPDLRKVHTCTASSLTAFQCRQIITEDKDIAQNKVHSIGTHLLSGTLTEDRLQKTLWLPVLPPLPVLQVLLHYQYYKYYSITSTTSTTKCINFCFKFFRFHFFLIFFRFRFCFHYRNQNFSINGYFRFRFR